MTAIVPICRSVDSAKVRALAEDMITRGWVGHPILVDDDESNEPAAINGSHRIAAAALAGIDVPTHSLADSGIDIEALFFDCSDDDDVLRVIEEGHDDVAIQIMRDEVANNPGC